MSSAMESPMLHVPAVVLSEDDPLIKFSKQGDSISLRSLLSSMHPNEVRAYVNTADHRGNTPIFHSIISGSASAVHALLSFSASSNHPNTRHDTPLHQACDSGHIEIILLLLAYEANPHLINIHGQRCYEMGSHSRAQKMKLETMIKSAWQDLRREKEIRQVNESHENNSINNRKASVITISDFHSSKTIPSCLQSGWSLPNYFASNDLSRVKNQISQRTTPLLSSALHWTESSRIIERRKWREEFEARESLKQEAKHSLFQQLQQQFDTNSIKQKQIIQRRKTLAAGPHSEGFNRALYERTRDLNELAEKEKRKTQKLLKLKLNRKLELNQLQFKENEKRLNEIRAVMTEYANQNIRYGDDQRVLTRMFNHLCWAINIKEIKQKQEEEEKMEMNENNNNDKSNSGVFLTELIGQESDELPASSMAPSADENDNNSEVDEVKKLFNRVSSHYQDIPIQPNTRKYLSIILTTLNRILPPVKSITPQTAAPANINYPQNFSQRSPMSKTRQSSPEIKDCSNDNENDNIWRVTSWNDLQSPSTQSIDRKISSSASKSRNNAMKSSSSQSYSRSSSNINSPFNSHYNKDSHDNDTANLSAMLTREIHKQIQLKQQKQFSSHQQSMSLMEQEELLIKKLNLIETLFPDLSPSHPLYQLLLETPMNEKNNENELLNFIQSGEFLPNENTLIQMIETLNHGNRENNNDQSKLMTRSTITTNKSLIAAQSLLKSSSPSIFPPLARTISNDSVSLRSTLVSKPAPYYS